MSPKWVRQPEARPGQILAAALEEFSRRGYRGATMEGIARAAGVTKGTIYLYFAGKQALFIATLRAQVRALADLLPGLRMEAEADLGAYARTMAARFLELLMTPSMAKAAPLFIGEINHMPALRRAYLEEWMPQFSMKLATALDTAMAAGVIRRLDPVITARTLMGMFTIFVLTQEVFDAKSVTPMRLEDIAETIATIFLEGVRNAR